MLLWEQVASASVPTMVALLWVVATAHGAAPIGTCMGFVIDKAEAPNQTRKGRIGRFPHSRGARAKSHALAWIWAERLIEFDSGRPGMAMNFASRRGGRRVPGNGLKPSGRADGLLT